MNREHPLAWAKGGRPFEPPADAIAWKVCLDQRGKTRLVYGSDGPLFLDLDADLATLRRAVGGKVGRYKLVAVDNDGHDIEECPFAFAEVIPTEPPPTSPTHAPPAETEALRDVLKHLVDASNRKDEMLQALARTAIEQTAAIQSSVAQLIDQQNNTLQIATGERLYTALESGDINKLTAAGQESGLMQLMNSPVGLGLMNTLKGFLEALKQQHQQKIAPAGGGS